MHFISAAVIVFHHHHHHHISVMQLGHLLTRSILTYPKICLKFYHDSFCQSDSSVSLPWVIYFEAFYLHVVSSFSCIPVICPKLVLFSTPLQFVHLFCNLSQVYPAIETNTSVKRKFIISVCVSVALCLSVCLSLIAAGSVEGPPDNFERICTRK